MSNFIGAKIKHTQIWLAVAILGLLVACNQQNTDQPAEEEQTIPTTIATAEVAEIPPPPTQTPEPVASPTPPLAALVNQRPILLTDYEQKIARYEQAQNELGLPPGDGYHNRLFLDLIEQEILQQAADQWGIELNNEMAQARLEELRDQSGGAENFTAWLEANQTTEEEFSKLIEGEMLAAAVLAQVTIDVPYELPHLRASYLEVADQAQAATIAAEIAAGTPFATAAQTYSLDRATAENGGDLGYFAEGFLLVPALEAVAWQLGAGEVSQVITVTHSNGNVSHYLITVTEAASPRPLSEGQRAQLLQKTFENWLAEQLATAEIVRFVD